MIVKIRDFSLPAVLLLIAFLVGCGGSTSLPPERPHGQVTGYATAAAINGGTVSVYSFTNGARGELLGNGTTDSSGAFNIKIYAPSQTVLVEVTGGSYVEEDSGSDTTVPATAVPLKSGETLSSLVDYKLEETVSTSLTPLTHMVTALAEYKMENGATEQQAMDDALATVNSFFNIDVRATNSVNIANYKPVAGATLSGDALYGYYLAGLSHWTTQASRKNNVPPNTTYTSVGISQIMYNDIRSDGLLDGQGFNNDKTQLVPLAFGPAVPLNADEYRSAFSIHMLAMANKTNLSKPASDNLSTAADDIAAQTDLLLGASQPLDISVRDIKIALAQPKDGYYSSDFGFNLDVQGILGIEQINIMVDGAAADIVGDPLTPPIVINTQSYTDTTHSITVQVTNALGYSDSINFDAKFDNTGPEVTLTPLPPMTNMTSVQVSGTYSDNYAGVASITVNGGAVSFANGAWSTSLQLAQGDNAVSIVVTDSAGNQKNIDTAVYVDTILPVIDTSLLHSSVRWSNGDGTSTAGQLHDGNLNTIPLYLETNYPGFKVPYGQVLSRSTLDADQIPYFAFTISDLKETGVAAATDELTVSMQYERSGVVLNDWHELAVQPQCVSTPQAKVTSCEVLLPLISEILDPATNVVSPWNETTPDATHLIHIQVSDAAGNVSTIDFSFKVDFFVPPITVCTTQPCSNDQLTVTDLDPFTNNFAQRDTALYNASLDTTTYSFTNPSNQSIYIRMDEPVNTAHTVIQTQERYIRIHHIQQTHEVVWQVIPIDALATCPVPTSAAWYTVGTDVKVSNWDGVTWQDIQPPAPVVTDYDLTSESLPSTSTNIISFVDPDTALKHEESTVGRLIYSYDGDYLIDDLTGNQMGYAYVTNWSVTNTNNNHVTFCTEQRYFQQIVTDTYATLVAPHNEIQDITPSTTATFNTETFKVLADQVEVQPVSGGWYAIPAGAHVDIVKVVHTTTTPPLVFREDSFAGDAPYTTPFPTRDKSLQWSINRDLNIYAILNTGEANISAMSQRDTAYQNGDKVYLTARP